MKRLKEGRKVAKYSYELHKTVAKLKSLEVAMSSFNTSELVRSHGVGPQLEEKIIESIRERFLDCHRRAQNLRESLGKGKALLNSE